MVSVLEQPLSAPTQAVAPPTTTGRTAVLDATAPGVARMQADTLDLDDAAAAAAAAKAPSSDSDSDDLPPNPAKLSPPPFYDPGADDEDEKYLSRREIGKGGGEQKSCSAPLPSDASLSCPGCFSTLTRCSQRHAEDPGVWRSLFVDDDAVVVERGGGGGGGGGDKRTPPSLRACSSSQWGRDGAATAAGATANAPEAPPLSLRRPPAEQELSSVACAVCDEVVGCVEEDGVFVFFSVLPSA